MKNQFRFTFDNIQSQYELAITKGYKIITCADFNEKYWNKGRLPDSKILINRVDIDFSIKKAEIIGGIFNKLGIKGSFYVRLHAPEYNPFSFENYRILKHLIDTGHEIGYHSEIVDQAAIWNETAEENLTRDIQIINRMFNIKIKGVASHGGMTGLNNLDFWKDKEPIDFELLYEAYDWFDKTFYISDSEWTRWKCYDNGNIVVGDNRSLGEHVQCGQYPSIYSLIHSDTYYNRHFYE